MQFCWTLSARAYRNANFQNEISTYPFYAVQWSSPSTLAAVTIVEYINIEYIFYKTKKNKVEKKRKIKRPSEILIMKCETLLLLLLLLLSI